MVISERGICRMLVYRKLAAQSSSRIEHINTGAVNVRRFGRRAVSVIPSITQS